jgi:hypothetical protein
MYFSNDLNGIDLRITVLDNCSNDENLQASHFTSTLKGLHLYRLGLTTWRLSKNMGSADPLCQRSPGLLALFVPGQRPENVWRAARRARHGN